MNCQKLKEVKVAMEVQENKTISRKEFDIEVDRAIISMESIFFAIDIEDNNDKVFFKTQLHMQQFISDNRKLLDITNYYYDFINHLIVSKNIILKRKISNTEALKKQIKTIKNTLKLKSEEYDSKTQALNNFKIAADLTHSNMSTVCYGYLLKHLISVYEMIVLNREFEEEIVEEKFGDLINYIIILKIIKNIEKE